MWVELSTKDCIVYMWERTERMINKSRINFVFTIQVKLVNLRVLLLFVSSPHAMIRFTDVRMQQQIQASKKKQVLLLVSL